MATISGGKITDYNAEVKSWADYYAFGMMIPGRQGNSEEYRYGFNGKEKDDEVKEYDLNGTEVSNPGTQYDYGFRIYDSRLGRFLSVDPLTKKFAMLTPYQFASNTPIWAIDMDGLEALVYTITLWTNSDGEVQMNVVTSAFNEEKANEGILYVIHDLDTDEVRTEWIKPVHVTYEPSMLEDISSSMSGAGTKIVEGLYNLDASMRGPDWQGREMEGEEGLRTYSNALENTGTGLQAFPLTAPLGKGLGLFSLAIETGLDFKNLETEDAVSNLVIRAGAEIASEVVGNLTKQIEPVIGPKSMPERAVGLGLEFGKNEVINEVTKEKE